MKAGEWNIKLLPPTFSSRSPKKPHSKQIAMLMSSGVDSSVAAYLLKQHGWGQELNRIELRLNGKILQGKFILIHIEGDKWQFTAQSKSDSAKLFL